jgi:hypothetical protein
MGTSTKCSDGETARVIMSITPHPATMPVATERDHTSWRLTSGHLRCPSFRLVPLWFRPRRHPRARLTVASRRVGSGDTVCITAASCCPCEVCSRARTSVCVFVHECVRVRACACGRTCMRECESKCVCIAIVRAFAVTAAAVATRVHVSV